MLKFDVLLKKLTGKKKSEIGNHTRQTFGILCSKDRTHPRTCVFTSYEYSQYSQYIGIDPHAPAFLHGRAPSSFLPLSVSHPPQPVFSVPSSCMRPCILLRAHIHDMCYKLHTRTRLHTSTRTCMNVCMQHVSRSSPPLLPALPCSHVPSRKALDDSYVII